MEIAILPTFIIRKMISDDKKQIHGNVLISSTLIILCFILFNTFSNNLTSIPHFCLFDKVLQIPCPGCGVTRSFVSIAQAKFTQAWLYNPAGVLLFLFLGIQIPMRIIALSYDNLSDSISKVSRKMSLFITVCLIVVWIIKIINNFL